MRVGIDLSPLQTPHRMRGIGYTLINFINKLPEDERKSHSFVFYTLPPEESMFKDAFELLDLKDMDFTTVAIKPQRSIPRLLPERLNIIVGVANRLLRYRNFYMSVPRISNLREVDVFLQANQSEPLPKHGKAKKILILYDLIPYVLESDYWWTYRSARVNGCSRKGAVRFHVQRKLLANKIKVNTKRADRMIAISKKTKQDFVQLMGVPSSKIEVSLLGVTTPKAGAAGTPALKQYETSNWGYIKRDLHVDLAENPYLLYVGGTDKRRKLEDVVVAFNHLRAQGHELKLVLAGDIMLGPKAITTKPIKEALLNSSYIDDIVFMGFIDDNTRDWLYRNALAFVFPSRYEGFGLPVLEAMVLNCPVVSYKNDAVVEVAGDAPLYADDAVSLTKVLKELISYNQKQLDALKHKGAVQAKRYDWSETSKEIMTIITKSAV